MTKSFISFYISILVVIIVAAVISGFYAYKNYEEPTSTTESFSCCPQKTMKFVDSYDVVTPSNFGVTAHSIMYVVHDDDRNVTCWLYDDGISCIPDRFLEEVRK